MAPPKKKAEKMAIGQFLQDQTLGSWADEMEEQGVMPLPAALAGKPGAYKAGGDRAGFGGSSDRFAAYSVLPPRQELPLPSRPPFTAHIGNLAFDVTDREIKDYFQECEVTSVRVVEDQIDRKPKGFGYIEFASVEGLKKALELNGTQFANRNVRVSIAEPPKDRGDRGPVDWTRRGPLPELPGADRRISDRGGLGPRSFSRNLDAASDAGSEVSERRRGGFEQSDGKVRDFSNWERRGPLQPFVNESSPSDARPHSKEGFDRFERRNSPRDSPNLPDRTLDGSRPPRRDLRDRPMPDRAPTAAEADSEWRKGARPDAPPSVVSRDNSTPSSPALAQAPSSRPRLNLQKRSETVKDVGSPAEVSDAKSSPFGAAKPADTAARDKVVAEKLEERKAEAAKERKAAEEKRIADEKAALEKKLAERKERGGADSAADASASTERASSRVDSSVKPNTSNDNTAVDQSTHINELAAMSPTDPMARSEQEQTGEGADVSNGTTTNGVTQQDSVKPQEVVRDIKAGDGDAPTGATTAAALEEEGWSTVGKAGKKSGSSHAANQGPGSTTGRAPSASSAGGRAPGMQRPIAS